MARATPYARERTHEKLVELCHSGLDVPAFFDEAGRLLRLVVPFDGFCSLSLDPATLLPTSHFTHNSMPPEDVPASPRTSTCTTTTTSSRRWPGLHDLPEI